MKTVKHIIIVTIALMGIGCYSSLLAQDEGDNNNITNKPNVRINVHKQTDKDGNIISYDSTYTYTFNGNQADTAMINSMLKNNMGNMSMHFFSNPGSAMPDFMTDPFFQHMDINMDMGKMQKMMQEQMQQLMQNGGMYNMQDFLQQMQKPVPEPKKCPKQQNTPSKNCQPKNNVVSGGVQI